MVADVSQTAGLAWDLGCGVLVSTFYPSLKFPERGLCGSERQDSPLQVAICKGEEGQHIAACIRPGKTAL